MASSWWKRSLTQPQNGHSTKTGVRVHNGVRWYKGKQSHHRCISFLSKPKDVTPVTHAVLVHSQGTQQPAPLLSVPFSPCWALLHTPPASDQACRPSLATGKSTQACIRTQTHVQLHSATAVIVAVSMNDHRPISPSTALLYGLQKGSLQPSSPAIWHHHAYRKPFVKIH